METFTAEQFEIIDAHTHIYPEKISQKATDAIGDFYDIKMYSNGSSEALIENGKRIGIKKYLVCSAATIPSQVESINNFIMEETKLHSEFFPFGTMHADYENIGDEIDRMVEMGFKGIKLHPDFQKFDIDSENAYKIYEAAEGRLPVLFHMGDDRYDFSKPHRLKRVLSDFKNLKVLAAHFGGYRCWEEAKESIGRNPNVRFDTSSSLPMISREMAKGLIDYYGVENMFFGTDFPMWSATEELERFFSLGLSFEDNRKIFSENFKEFFGIEKL